MKYSGHGEIQPDPAEIAGREELVLILSMPDRDSQQWAPLSSSHRVKLAEKLYHWAAREGTIRRQHSDSQASHTL